MIICIGGLPGSGKSTVAAILESKGFKTIEVSKIIKEEMAKNKINITMRNVENFSNEVKKTDPHMLAITTIAAKKLMYHNGDAAIIGFRSMPQVYTIREILGDDIPAIAITAPKKIRYARLSKRGNMRVRDYKEFLMRERNNIKQGALKIVGEADYVIVNSGTNSKLKATVNNLLKELKELKNEQK